MEAAENTGYIYRVCEKPLGGAIRLLKEAHMQFANLQARKAKFLSRRASRQAQAPTRHYLDAYLLHINEIPILREAYAQTAFWQNAQLEYYPEELIAGIAVSHEPVGFHYGSGTYVDTDGDEAAVVREHSYQNPHKPFITPREAAHLEAHASTSTWFGGHMVLDFETVFDIGLEGYREKIYQNAARHGNDKRDFFKAMEVELDGVIEFTIRLAEKAAEAGNNEVAEVLRHIAHKPPMTFHQALQLCWILHYLDNSDSFGRFDKYLLPFFERDNLPRHRAKELIADFWLKIEDAEQIQNMTIGGEYSDLTLLCLEVTKELAFKGPNLCLRVTADIRQNIWDAALDSIGAGLGQPALYNDGMYTASLIKSGIDAAAAQNYCFAGCSQIMIPGESNFYNDIGMFNVAKIFELTLHDGFDPRIGKQVGIHTGAAETFGSFDTFMAAFIQQLKDACKIQAEFHNKELLFRASKEGYALRTLFTKDCLERAKGVFEGGARYNNIQLEMIGITNAADSLYTIKKTVFDEQRLTLAELRDILAANWEGHENLQAYFRSLPKFGNGVPEVDGIRANISEFLYSTFNNAPAILGGCFVPGEVIFKAHKRCGEVTGATPDGRSAEEVLADSAGASMGCSREGPTALMNSVLAIPVKDYLLTSVVLNIRFLPDTFNSSVTRKGVSALLRSYFAQGGMQMQINVCDSAKLKEARKNPELYGDLIVRVGGYSDYFVRLSPVLQNEIIARAEYA